MNIVKCGVVGVGYLGKFHAEKYANLPQAELTAVCDKDSKSCNEIANHFHALAIDNYQDLVGKVDAVSIATPTLLHHEIAKFFLENNIHVLIEKPITTTVAEAEELIALAEKNNLVLQVGHLERFNSAMKAAENHLDAPHFIDCSRLAPFKLRGADVNVVLDLMIHDIDLIQHMVNSPIQHIYANGACVVSNEIDIANARIQFNNGCVANVTASRVSLKPERSLKVFQRENYLALDLQSKKLTLHYKGVNEMFPGIREMLSEEQVFDQGDALREQIIAFLNSIINGQPATVSGHDGKLALATAIEITHIIQAQHD